MEYSTLSVFSKNAVVCTYISMGFFVFFVFFLGTPQSGYSQSLQSHADSLQHRLQEPIHDTLKLQYHMDLAHLYMDIDPSKMLPYTDNALVLAEKLGFEKEKGFIHNYKGVYYQKKGEFQLALQHFLSALSIMEQTGHMQGRIEGLMNIGNVYLTLENYKEAEKYLLQALELSENSSNENSTLMLYNNLGIMYSRQAKVDKASKYYLQALGKAKEKSNKSLMISLYINMANGYMSKGDQQQGLDYFLEALVLSKETGNGRAESEILIALGQLYKLEEKYPKAIEYLDKGLEKAIAIDDRRMVILACLHLSEVYEQQGDFEKAFRLREKYGITKDILDKNLIQMTNVLSDYEVGKKQEEVVAKDEELKDTTAQKKTITVIGAIVALLLLLLGGYLYLRKQRLASEKKQVEWENDILGQTNLDLKQRIEMLSEEIRNQSGTVTNHSVQKNKKYRTSSLSKKERDAYMNQILDYMETEKPYLDYELTLGKLADALEIPSYHLSEVLNEALGKNFYDFINIYRVEAVKEHMADPKTSNLTLLAIAFDAGFNSKTAFNRAFKKATGLSPSRFKQQLKDDQMLLH